MGMDVWRELPQHIDPVLFSIGFWDVYWYAVCYLVGFSAALVFLLFRRKRNFSEFSRDDVWDLSVWGFLGGIIGGRLGYVFFYNFEFFFARPLRIVWPFDESGAFVGIAGMSFFGAMIGTAAAIAFLAKKRRWSVWQVADFLAPAVPIGIFFGRIGNFFNGELYGRPSDVFWAMDVGDGVLRHPSQLYEVMLEGVVLFAVLLWLSRFHLPKGMLAVAFLGGYGMARFFAEFFREPDAQIGFVAFGWLTIGQFLSILAILAAILLGAALLDRGKQTR